MNIYLDINGVLLTKNLQQALYLEPFLTALINRHSVFWLTTHCKGDATPTIQYLSFYLDKECLKLCKTIKPTNWQTLKTEAIDMTQDFLWFDDYILDVEKQILLKHNKIESWIKVDLEDNPRFLSDSTWF